MDDATPHASFQALVLAGDRGSTDPLLAQSEARVQALALEAKLQIAREHAPPSPSLTLEAGETVDAAEGRRAQRLQERFVSMVGLPESGPWSGWPG